MRNFIFKIRDKIRWIVYHVFHPIIHVISYQVDLSLDERFRNMMDRSRNPLSKCGAKYFSQNEEDGITLEILRRIGIDKGTFVEIGIGNGLENNTLILLASGWKGLWIGGEELAFSVPSECKSFCFLKRWINRDNIYQFLKEGLRNIGSPKEIDLLSLDIDGYDLHALGNLLEAGLSAKVIIVEYNGKFPPPIEWAVAYEKDLQWDGTDYMGASLASYQKLLAGYGYRLVCCNVTGIDAFFVKSTYMNQFSDVPTSIKDIYYPPFYRTYSQYGHPTSPKTVVEILRRLDEIQ